MFPARVTLIWMLASVGRATIIEAGEEDALYTVSLDFGSAELNARIVKLANQQAAKGAALSARQSELITARSELGGILSTLDSAVIAYTAKLVAQESAEAEKQAVEDATKAAAGARSIIQRIETNISRLQIEITNINNKIAYLQGFDLTETRLAWCADYTTDATGAVATIEVPGEPATVLIAPGAVTPTDADGDVVAKVAQDATQHFLNGAILPGWQKFSPTYRFATIDDGTINRTTHTCDVTLDPATSSAQGLGINSVSALEDVPINYQFCDSAAFEDGDEVVVAFEGQSWDNPKVIGFKSGPRQCPGVVWRWRYVESFPQDTNPEPYTYLPTQTTYNLVAVVKSQALREHLRIPAYDDGEGICEIRIDGGPWIPFDNTNGRATIGYGSNTAGSEFRWNYSYSVKYGDPDDENLQIQTTELYISLEDTEAYLQRPGTDGSYREAFSFDDIDQNPFTLGVVAKSFGSDGAPWPGHGWLSGLAPSPVTATRVDEIRFRFNEIVYFHIAYKPLTGEVFNYCDIDIFDTDIPNDLFATTADDSLPITPLEGYEFAQE